MPSPKSPTRARKSSCSRISAGRRDPTRKIRSSPWPPKSAHIIKRPVKFVGDCVGDAVERAVAAMKNGDIAPAGKHPLPSGRRKKRPHLRRATCQARRHFVNDAFSAVAPRARLDRRPGASLPAYAGRSVQAELEAFEKVLDNPARPLAAIVGGAKISTKLDLLGNLLRQGRRADHRRRHGQHVSACARQSRSANRWPSRPGRHRAQDHGRSQSGGTSARSCCRSTRWWRRNSRRMRRPGSSMSTTSAERHDPRHRSAQRRTGGLGAGPLQDAGLERPVRRLRDGTVRQRHESKSRKPRRN